MANSSFTFVRQQGSRRRLSTDLLKTLGSTPGASEKWLFVSPHDDDLCIGAGLWIQAAMAAGVEVHVLILTDGAMGYCTLAQRKTIVRVREGETYASFATLGVARQRIRYGGFPDSGLAGVQGRRRARRGEPQIAGYTGLANTLTWHLRRVRPTRVLVPTLTDLHPDHQVTYRELLISLFHASGAIWPELGKPMPVVPKVYEMAVYCDFAAPPNLGIRSGPGPFQRKLDSVAAYRSQEQIEQIVDQVKQAGPYEFLREVEFRLYSAKTYMPMFQGR